MRETLQVVKKVLYGDCRTKKPRKGGYFGGFLSDGHGHRVLDLLICTPNRVTVTSVLNPDKWKRKGAKGFLADGKYPKEGESVRGFVKRWCDVMNAKVFAMEVGSRDDTNRVLEGYYEREAHCMRRKRGENGVSKRGRPRKQSVSHVSRPRTPELEVSPIGSRVVDSEPCVESFIDLVLEFNLPVEGLSCFLCVT